MRSVNFGLLVFAKIPMLKSLTISFTYLIEFIILACFSCAEDKSTFKSNSRDESGIGGYAQR